ncbi:MAG: hypothetical protein HZA50_12560 [Planctomycetes bacterium]|nr:hypothetical protein [Planctomycetota bacterium]
MNDDLFPGFRSIRCRGFRFTLGCKYSAPMVLKSFVSENSLHSNAIFHN